MTMSHYFREFEWHEPGKEPKPGPKPTLEQQFAQLRWQTVDWGDIQPPAGLPHAVAKSRMAGGVDNHVYVVWRLSDGRCVFDLGFRNEWSTPGGKTGS